MAFFFINQTFFILMKGRGELIIGSLNVTCLFITATDVFFLSRSHLFLNFPACVQVSAYFLRPNRKGKASSLDRSHSFTRLSTEEFFMSWYPGSCCMMY